MRSLVVKALVRAVLVALVASTLLATATLMLASHGADAGVDAYVYGTASVQRVYQYVEPRFQAVQEPGFASLYEHCAEDMGSRSGLYYVGTIRAEGLQVSVYRDVGGGDALLVYHVGERVLECVSVKPVLVREVESGLLRLGGNTTGHYEYSVYRFNVVLAPPEAMAREGGGYTIAPVVAIYEIHVSSTITYRLGAIGEHKAHLKGIVWVKEEDNGSRVVINTVEAGSYGERVGALGALFSECVFEAWAEHNEFAGFIKARWAIAENTCPATAEYRGRPVAVLYADGTLELHPGGPSGSLKLGCGCYG